ncbi:hypothetical protein Agub_g10201 [Astrephomene gubernaculifera]|uniref:Uncharacterized protein n=1 Tax=Astrephomene gubernaculifera TaxID=47775 RepID=A0AAD3HNV1_9CHLO|nr:hypothetical protein Agub_g10201 [Astrephomene gubernaculifera]
MSARYVEALFRAVSSSATKLDLQGVLSNLSAATAAATAASAAPLDHLYARIGALNGPFFPAGWGNLSVVNYEEDLRHLIQGPPSSIKLSWRLIERGNRDGTDYLLYEGTFRTPCLQRVFDALPPESRTGRVQLLVPAHIRPFRSETSISGLEEGAALPYFPSTPQQIHHHQQQSRLRWPGLGSADATAQEQQLLQQHLYAGTAAAAATASAVAEGPACVVHLAATGDQTFGRRLRLGFPLLKDNICTLVLESPFYGARRPAAQRGSKLLRVSDLLTLGWATIAESLNLLHWLREEGYGPLGMCGLSMGGVHACMTAGLYPGDVAVTPLLAPRSAAVAYCDGAMRAVMAWEPLLKEVDENDNQITQVVMSAGRAITIKLPVRQASSVPSSSSAAAAASAAYPTTAAGAAAAPSPSVGISSGSGGGDSADADAAAAAAAFESVSLMREATYALADLEVRGEKRHLAEAASSSGGSSSNSGGSEAAGSPPSLSSTSSSSFSLPSSGEAETGAAADGRRRGASSSTSTSTSGGDGESRSRGGGEGAAAGGGLLKGLPQPLVSVMDVYMGLAGAALRAGGSSGSSSGSSSSSSSTQGNDGGGGGAANQTHGNPSPPFGHNQHQQQQPEQQEQRECGGPFSGIIADPSSRHASEARHPHSHSHAHHHHHQHHHHHHHPQQPRPHNSASSGAPQVAGGGEAGGGGGGTPLGRRLLGDLGRAVKQLRSDDRRLDNPDTVMRLKRVLETYTDITRYPRPRRTDAAVIIAARDDAYVSTQSVEQLHRYWEGSELRMVSGGHVSAFLMHQEAFRTAIKDSLTRLSRPPPPPSRSRQ